MASLTGAWHTVQPYIDPGNMLAGGPKNSTPGGTVGNADPTTAYGLQKVPGTNYSYNSATGQYYQTSTIDPATGQTVDLGATTVAQAPNLAQQGSGAAIQQNAFLSQQQDALDRMAATRAGQTGLATDYNAAIHGTAPSMAASQLYTGMNHISQDQLSQAAGANGQNALAARRVAAQNTARAQGDLSGQLAITRANEVAQARAGLANLYGSESQADTSANTNATGAALGYGGLGEKSEADRIGADTSATAEYNKQRASVLMGLGGAFSSFYGGKKE